MADRFPLDVDTLLSVLNYVNLGIYITDLDRRIVLWNRKAEEITGYRAAEVVGKACREQVLNHVDKHGRALCTTRLCPLYRSMSIGKESDEPILIYARTATGSRVAVSVSVAPLRDESGKVIGGIEAFRDETRRIRDLEFARTVQQNLLPQTFPELQDFAFDVRYYPHELIGGDFYDIRHLGSDRYGFMVADVRGHGVSAALYTMVLRSLEESLSDQASDPGAFVEGLNRELMKFVVAESFATVFYGILDTGRCQVMYSNAGHPPPLHVRGGDGEVTRLHASGLPLGVVEHEAYDTATIDLKSGDLLLCYTDGMSEVVDENGKMLGSSGLARFLVDEMARGSDGLLARLYQRVLATCGNVSLSDDVLLLSVRHRA